MYAVEYGIKTETILCSTNCTVLHLDSRWIIACVRMHLSSNSAPHLRSLRNRHSCMYPVLVYDMRADSQLIMEDTKSDDFQIFDQ